jgi:1-phosphatidylinositol-4-phosphate 5-kinase
VCVAFSSLFYGKYDGWLRHKGSDGKSGSIFYISHDSRFMVKTVSHEENITLRRTLRAYVEYVEKNPHTLLMRTLGMFKLRTNGAVTGHGGKKAKSDFYLIVIANAFYTDLRIHETYDLKVGEGGRVKGLKG